MVFRVLHRIHKTATDRFIPANAKNIHRAIHALVVIFPQPSPLYFHSNGKDCRSHGMIGVAIALRTRSRFLIAAAITAAACLGAITLDCAAAQTPPDYGNLLTAADRSDADRDADKRRDPAPFLAFAAPRPGMKVLDMGAGGGYSSELMAREVAPNGIVFGQNPADLGERAKAAFEARLDFAQTR